MKERPILFSAPMVRALLAGTKTQTRRVMARQKQHTFTDYTLFGQRGHADDQAARRGGWAQPWVAIEHAPDWPDGKDDQCFCPYARERGDRLWVRESWSHSSFTGARGEIADVPERFRHPNFCHYAAEWLHSKIRWTPGIHMPRWASRIMLDVTAVRVERLQDISEADAIAEGIVAQHGGGWGLPAGEHFHFSDPRISYFSLWEAINGPGSVEANPWVWAVSFRKVAL